MSPGESVARYCVSSSRAPRRAACRSDGHVRAPRPCGIAAKALLPGVGSIINKYGLRPTGEKITEYQREKSIKEAEEHIEAEFESANTLQVINPILQELELTLRTTESQHDPLTGPSLANGSIPELDGDRWRELTEIAICHVYQEAYETPSLHKKANLGPENLRWLKMMFDINHKKEQ